MSSKYAIGSITTGYRPIKDGKKYDKYFPKPETHDRIIIQDGEVTDTVDLMTRVVWKYIDDTKAIAPVLKGDSTEATCRNIWEFLYHNIQYKLDKRGLEQLRRPARSWADRQSGIDCDCFSIFCSSILTNLQIPHAFRITKYGGDHFQHVYVVVEDQGQSILIDPVLSEFNYEKPFTQKQDFTMNLQGIDVAVLSGTSDPLEETLLGFQMEKASEQEQLDAMYHYLIATRNTLAQDPNMISQTEDPEGFIKMLDYAIQYWHTDKRDEALAVLEANEQQLNQMNGLHGDDGLGAAKGFFRNVRSFAQKAGKGIKSAAKVVAKTVVKYNPISLAARSGFLVALRLNLRKMASKLKWAYGSQAQAAKHGISASEWSRSKVALAKVEHLFADKLQGNRQKMKDAILKGRAGGLSGPVHLGEPVTLAASIAAATPVIVAALKIMKDAGLIAPGEASNTGNLSAEAEALNRGIMDAAPRMVPQSQYENGTSVPATYNNPGLTPGAPSTGGGFVGFIKKHPVVAAVGAGAIAFGAYKMLSPKKKAKGLSGPRKTTVRKRAPTKRTRAKSTPSKIQKVNLF